MKKLFFLIPFLPLIGSTVFAQVSINIDGTQPAPSAGLDVKFSNQGFLLPRLSQSMIQSILNPTDGLQVYCATDSKIYIYVASVQQWKELAYGPGTISPPPFSCGTPITINHFSGLIAPVNKTVTYGTVTNIPGETTKCWITSNLGSDYQATAVSDATEASAGWYWQFNRKQGYKHDGTTRTPNTTWINSISEYSDWITANDPCNIELGSTWRIPTSTEWYNVDNTGGWTSWNDSYGSMLKLHAAGYLNFSDGSLGNRGFVGDYWSSQQSDVSYGWFLNFSSGGSNMKNTALKAYGFSVRCVRD
jgi:hypothetical protein